ncbi:hypothetical protein [Paenarthrobacter aurescens]|uniref:Secreted protein n=1 Tax=Paenarthrobacter aurescens TaxID=43663 RepID=A0A4Y3NG74_PAEAU|nr:hypothetical protein [Paenarthrobacter aurescens]MDO6142113.1 hypothetical protein [Paenarthrobacter aurescens]MDO6145919.1 hypothetical protein [Paenarthrobacter aurescens]MDO6157163.1 hypothetical protein [Paenarthrobacter aurescens]MDO6161148.1 hypothetical protein [Paenarthrobacter aurescens]GEB21014.1 hypothetical protein AAU01_37690 [Paenarthrobacter aurescens]
MSRIRTKLATSIAAAAIIGMSLVGAPAANAETIGDGTTAPTHDSGTAVIPLCNPFSVIKWLTVNFTDHGRDIANYEFTLQTPLEVVQYAGADALFHIPMTLFSLGGFTSPTTYCTVGYEPTTGI